MKWQPSYAISCPSCSWIHCYWLNAIVYDDVRITGNTFLTTGPLYMRELHQSPDESPQHKGPITCPLMIIQLSTLASISILYFSVILDVITHMWCHCNETVNIYKAMYRKSYHIHVSLQELQSSSWMFDNWRYFSSNFCKSVYSNRCFCKPDK